MYDGASTCSTSSSGSREKSTAMVRSHQSGRQSGIKLDDRIG
jgi:hypothetical protein